MRYSFIVLFLLVLVGCKKDSMEISKVEPPKEVQLPCGVLDFSVKGVPKENIRYVAIDSDDPSRIVVDLPVDYKGGDKIEFTFKMPVNWCIFSNAKVHPSTNELDYNVEGIFIIIKDTVDQSYNGIDIYVNPSAPLGAPSVGHDYEYTLEGENIYIYTYLH